MDGTIRLKIKGNLPGYMEGEVVVIKADENGTPLDQYWRRRLRDSKHDGCVELIQAVKKTSSKKTVEEPAAVTGEIK